jgi:uncharacterized SAM-binding protein YcdF (DUF218 family)
LVQQTVVPKDTKAYSVGRMVGMPHVRSVLQGAGRMRYRLKIAGILLLALTALLGVGFLLFWGQIKPEPAREVGRADGIVVLTGGDARIPEAVKLLSQGKGRRLLISGVNPSTTRTELAGLAPGSQHLFRCCVDVGREARDTIGNADETSQWVKERRFKSLIVVTASYHMPRSMMELRRTLPDVRLIAYPVQPRNVHVDSWWAHPGTLQLLVTEYLKAVPAFLRCMSAQFGRGTGVGGSARQCLGGAGAG